MPAAFSSYADAADYNHGAVSASKPSGTASGDLLVAVVLRYEDSGNSAAAFTGPSGWTQQANNLALTYRVRVYTKVAGGSEPTSYSWTYGASGDGYGASLSIARVVGANTGSIFDATPVFASLGSSTSSITAPGVSPALADSLLLCGWMFEESMTDRTLTVPAAMTGYGSYPDVGGLFELHCGWQALTSSGTTGTKTATLSSGTVAAQHCVSMAIRSSPSGGATQVMTITASADGAVSTGPTADQVTTITAVAGGTVNAQAQATQVMTITATADGAVSKPPFPQTPLPLLVELELGGVWTDVTALTYGREATPISITRGRTGEGATVERSTCNLSFDNRDGRFSPRNPSGPWYGLLGRNTPLRVTLTEGGPHLAIGGQGDNASCPDTAGISVTGDLDVRIDLWASDWLHGNDLVGQGRMASGTGSWLVTTTTGNLGLFWSTDGTNATGLSAFATMKAPWGDSGRRAIRVTLDVDNGAGGWAATWFTAATMAGPWRQLGDVVTGAGVTSVYDSSAPLQVGDVTGPLPATLTPPVVGEYYAMELRSGIDGTVVASPNFVEQITDATSFFDAQGNHWQFNGSAKLSNTHTRFHGEIPEWPPAWDVTGRDSWVPIQAAGVLRRLQQGVSPLSSTLRRTLAAEAAAVAYWPCEDGEHSQSIGSALLGGLPMTVTTGTSLTPSSFASYSRFPCSSALPTAETSTWSGDVPTYAATGKTQLRFLMAVPSTGTLALDGAVVARLTTNGSITKIEIQYGTVDGGSLRLVAFNSSGTAVLTSAYLSIGLIGGQHQITAGLTETGGGVNWEFTSLRVGDAAGFVNLGTLASATVGTVTNINMNASGQLGSTVLGHIYLQADVTTIFDTTPQLNGYIGETAGQRMARLCAEAGIDFFTVGDPDETVLVGYQTQKTLVELLKDAADADGGILFEPRDRFGLAYRTRASLQRQNPLLSLSYPGHQMSELKPVEDDLSTRNDVSVSREGGASARQALQAGPLSVLPVPDGIGKYDTSLTLTLAADSDALPQAQWHLHLGTVDEARYPILEVNLASTAFTSDPQLVHDVLTADIGDRLIVTDPPMWVPPEDITQLIQGSSEKLGQFLHQIAWNLAPESPYRVGIYGDPLSRYAPTASTLDVAVSSSATTLSVATSVGPLWSHADGDFTIVASGEQMTVTAVTGTTSPQSFTVVRSLNGVVKAHSVGESVNLAYPVYYAL